MGNFAFYSFVPAGRAERLQISWISSIVTIFPLLLTVYTRLYQ
jgi:hypothetical protein